MNWIHKILTAAGYYSGDNNWIGFWADPNGKLYQLQDTHHQWIYANMDLLYDHGIDIESWMMEREEEQRQECVQQEMQERIRDKSFELEIDESQIQLSDMEMEEIYQSCQDITLDRSEGVEIVDFLLSQGWIRLGLKWNNLYIEGNPDIRGFWDRAENALTEAKPKVWQHGEYRITVNNSEIYSRDLQQAGSLEKAVKQESRHSIHRR